MRTYFVDKVWNLGKIVICKIYTDIYGTYKSHIVNKDGINQHNMRQPSLVWKPQNKSRQPESVTFWETGREGFNE